MNWEVNVLERSDKGLAIETSAYGGLSHQISVFHFPTDAAPHFLQKLSCNTLYSFEVISERNSKIAQNCFEFTFDCANSNKRRYLSKGLLRHQAIVVEWLYYRGKFEKKRTIRDFKRWSLVA